MSQRLTSPAGRRAAARRDPRRELVWPRPAAEGQVLSRVCRRVWRGLTVMTGHTVWLSLFVLAAILGACTAPPSAADRFFTSVRQFTPGATTQEEVRSALGAPHGDHSDLWVYSYPHRIPDSDKFSEHLIEQQSVMLMISFDSSGVIERFSITVRSQSMALPLEQIRDPLGPIAGSHE